MNKLGIDQFPAVWLAASLALVLVLSLSPGHAVTAVLSYFMFVWVGALFVMLKEQRQLMIHLKKSHYSTWAYVTSGPSWPPGGRNSFRGLSFLFSAEDFGDKTLKRLKARTRRSLKWVGLAFLSMLIAAGGLVFLLATGKIPG